MRYRDYRRFGHGRIVSATLSTHPAIWYTGAIALAVVTGWFFELSGVLG